MKMHRILVGMLFGMKIPANNFEKAWDDYYLEFKAMLGHAAEVLKLSQDSGNGTWAVFSLDTGIILPLYIVATKCRHPVLRRRAIALLKSARRQEGVLNSLLTGRVAERLVELEEEGLENIECAEEFPNCARISNVQVHCDPIRRRAYLQYPRHKAEKSDRCPLHEWIEW